MSDTFYFATCQVAAEKAVKAEWKGLFPRLNFAFSRPGFVTFKDKDTSTPVRLDQRPGIFTRVMGKSISQWKGDETQTEDQVLSMLSAISSGAILHIFERDLYFPGDEPPDEKRNSRVHALIERVKREKKFRVNETPQKGDTVFDLIWLDPGHWLLGSHDHSADYDGSPGNIPMIELPPSAPSRAYLKIAEALHRFQIDPEEAEDALEVGCSPGGATFAMLSHGIRVVGVDPKDMDTIVSSNPDFRLVQKMAKNVSASDLEDINPDWLVMDINLTPQIALEELTHVVSVLKRQWGSELKMRRGFLTLKMSDWSLLSDIPNYLAQIERLGFKKCVPLQLASNRQEFMVVASR